MKIGLTKDIQKAIQDLDMVSTSLDGFMEDILEKNKVLYPNLVDYISANKISTLEEKNRILEEQNLMLVKLLTEVEQEIGEIIDMVTTIKESKLESIS